MTEEYRPSITYEKDYNGDYTASEYDRLMDYATELTKVKSLYHGPSYYSGPSTTYPNDKEVALAQTYAMLAIANRLDVMIRNTQNGEV